MTETSSQVYVLHLKKTDGRPLFLHPFNSARKVTEFEGTIDGRFGADPTIEHIGQLKEILYQRVDIEVRKRYSERRFIPKFLLSAAVFVVVYFVLSFAIRDPIPVIDELTGSIVASVICYLLLGRRDELSIRAVEERAAGRERVDAISFSPDPNLSMLEAAFAEADEDKAMPWSDLSRLLVAIVTNLPEEMKNEFRAMVEDQIGSRMLKRIRNHIHVRNEHVTVAELKRVCLLYKIDPIAAMIALSMEAE